MLFGDREGLFESWIQEHKGLILKVVRANAANAEDQNDLFQEIAFQVWRSIPSFRGEAKVSTWIYRVALNTAMIWRRSEKKHRHLHGCLYVENEPPDSNEIPSESLESRETLEWLYEEIRRLPPLDRSLVLLYLDARSYEETAEILGIAITHVGYELTEHHERSFLSWSFRSVGFVSGFVLRVSDVPKAGSGRGDRESPVCVAADAALS